MIFLTANYANYAKATQDGLDYMLITLINYITRFINGKGGSSNNYFFKTAWYACEYLMSKENAMSN